MAMVTVKCSDGTLIDADKDMMACMSDVFKKQIESLPASPSSTITLENINGNTLMKVLEFCNVHTSPNSVPNIKIWDERFVRLEPGDLCELASAAYHLEIKPLVDLTCKAIAKLLKGKSPSEIRRTFNILYDFSPGDDVPPPTIRDKLRTKLHYSQKKRDVERDAADSSEDTRSLADLISFIGGEQSSNKKKRPKAKPKRNGKHKRSISVDSDQSKYVKTGDEEGEEEEEEVNNKVHSVGLSLSASVTVLPDEQEDEEIDPQLKAEQDREVEEFRRRLESIERSERRPKITIPSTELELLVKNSCVISKG